MSSNPTDFRIEILRGRPQGLETFELGAPSAPEPLDVTEHAELDGLSAVNRALERDLLSFKTGDVTVTFDNPDGYFDDLFDPIVFTQTTIWSLRILRRGEVQFWGVLIGKGSVIFNRKDRQCEVTAYGLTKLLDMTSAEPVSRIFSAMTVTTATAGSSTLVLNTTISLLSGDTIHLTDHVNKEDVTVRQVLSSTNVLLEAALVNNYAAGSDATCTTPFHRYKSIAYLAEALSEMAGVPLSDLRISNSQFNTLAPTPVNLSGLATIATTNPVYTLPAEKDSQRFDTHLVNGTYRQSDPSADWVQDDATIRAWVDFSRYYTQTEAEPTVFLRDPEAAESFGGTDFTDPHYAAFDFKPVTKSKYHIRGSDGRISVRTTTDGTTWAARATVNTVPGARWNAASTNNEIGCEIDPGRQQLYIWSNEGGGGAGSPTLEMYDIAGGTFTSIRQADDTAGYCYGGFSWVPELDCVIGLRCATKNGPTFEIVAFRNGARLWKRAFPSCLIQAISGSTNTFWPTHTLRMVSGRLYCVVVSDGKAQLVSSGDQFVTYTMKALTDPGMGPRIFGARVNDAYQIACYEGTLQRGLFIAAPFYAGVVEYADFEGLSCAEAQNKLAVLANALFWVDDDLQGHFVARDLFDPGAVTDLEDRLMERSDDLLWDETAQYVAVSGNGQEATAGDAGFSSEGIDLESAFIPTEAFAQALADAVFAFYSAQRQMVEATVIDPDGRIYRPLDRVTLGGAERYLVYESDHDLASDEVRLTLLEDR